MKIISPLLLGFLLISACSKSGSGNENEIDVTQAFSPSEVVTTKPNTTSSNSSTSNSTSSELPNGALTFETNITFSNFSATNKEKVYKAADLIKQVVATKEFRSAVLAHKYKGIKQFNNNLGLTNTQIYNKILEASENLSPGKNNTLDVELELYTDTTNVVGYTYPSSKRIWMNTKYFNKFYPYQVSANLFHEWLHKIGFGHDYEATTGRPYSVPYAVGSIMRNMAKKFYNQ